ncbi:MAG: U32 family peptidase [Bacilli bacterium]|nr:U32 family peptidase [Bacilli bacterium]
MSNYLVLINNLDNFNEIKELGYTNFLFALKEYSIGYNAIEVEEINKLSGNKYLLINRILDSREIRLLEDLLVSLTDIKGLVFEDLGILKIVKKHNLPLELIYFHNHAGTNYETINFWLNEGMDSVLISNEITASEINEITSKANKPLVLMVFGHNQIMYSRRSLLTNYAKYHQIDKKDKLALETNNNHFIVLEQEYGTVFYTKNIYNYFSLKNGQYRFMLVNTVLLSREEELKVLKDIKNEDYTFNYLDTSEGFLNTKTIFKLGGKSNE